MKYRDGDGKHVLGEAMRGALPPEVLDRPKRLRTPSRSGWRDFGVAAQAAIHRSTLVERDLLDFGLIDELFAAPRGPGDWNKHLSNLYDVSGWYDRWVA